MTLVFVYGTLKRGEGNNSLLRGQQFLRVATTEPRWRLVDLGAFPGMVEGTLGVVGELWEVDDECLQQLDRLEGVPRLYRREMVDLDDEYGTVAWAYIYNRPTVGLEEIGREWRGMKHPTFNTAKYF